MRGRVRRLRAGLVTPRPGGSGAPPARHYDRAARCSLDWDRPKPGNARRSRVPGSAGLELSVVAKPPGQSRNGAPAGAAIPAKGIVHKGLVALTGAPSPSLRARWVAPVAPEKPEGLESQP